MSDATVRGYLRGDRGVGVRDVVLALPSVGCTNRTVELLRRTCPSLRAITHQHGCAQIGDDLRLTTEVLARVCAHPNVRAAVVIGLGCESNQPHRLAERARALGAAVHTTVLQEQGGVEATVAAAADLAAELLGQPPHVADVPLHRLRVALLVDAAAPARADRLHDAAAAALHHLGVEVLDYGRLWAAEPGPAWSRVHEAWRDAGPLRLPTGSVLGAPVASVVEQLALAAAAGAHLAVLLTGRATPVGSPVVPTLKVGVDARLRPLVGGVLDIDASDETTPAEAAAARIVDAVLRTAAGDQTIAERDGQRDFAIPRLAPSM